MEFPKELIVMMTAGCSPGHPLTPGSCLDISQGTELVSGSARYRLMEDSASSFVCAACGLPFETGECRTLQPDGSAVHELSEPASMRRCRDALLAALRGRR
jgi:hypothetical protein